MKCELEYLGEGELSVHGVGTFGTERFDRELKKQVRITRLPVTYAVARIFDADRRDQRFKVHGLSDQADKKTKKGGK